MSKAKPAPAEETQEPKLWSFSEIVKRTGVSTGTLQIAIKEGFVTAAMRHKYHPAVTLIGLIKFFQTRYGKMPTFDNAEQCSAATGIPVSAIKQVRRSSQAAFMGKRIDLAKLLRDLFALREEKDWRKEREEAEARSAIVQARKDENAVLIKADVKQAINAAMSKLFLALSQRSEVGLPPLLKGCDELTIRNHLLASDEHLKSILAAEWGKLLN